MENVRCVFSQNGVAHHEELLVIIHGLLSVDVDDGVQELVENIEFSRVRDDCYEAHQIPNTKHQTKVGRGRGAAA